MSYSHLNHYIPPGAGGPSEAWKRVMGRLGDYTALLARAMNLRPNAVALHAQTAEHLLVRLSVDSGHLILRVSPEDDLAAYVYFARSAAGQRIPAPQIIQRDLTRAMVPFAYTLEHYVAGAPASTIAAPHLLHGAGRQAGRALRRLHRVTTPGAGRPNPAGRWPTQGWRACLRQIGRQIAPPPADSLLFSEAERAAVAALLDDQRLEIAQPGLIHGAFGPQAVRCTTADYVHLEAIVEPGRAVGGDGMFDLACGLSPAHPAPWTEGLLEGYTGAGPLSSEEAARLPLLRLLVCYWGACFRYMRAEDHEPDRAEALRLLAELAPGHGDKGTGAQGEGAAGPGAQGDKGSEGQGSEVRRGEAALSL